MLVVKCNHNLIRPFEIILQILDLGHFQCPVSLWQKKKSLRKNNHLMQFLLIEQNTLKKNSYSSEHTEMKTDLVC